MEASDKQRRRGPSPDTSSRNIRNSERHKKESKNNKKSAGPPSVNSVEYSERPKRK